LWYTFLSQDIFGRGISESQSFHLSEVWKSVTNISARLLYVMGPNSVQKYLLCRSCSVNSWERHEGSAGLLFIIKDVLVSLFDGLPSALKATPSNRTQSPYSNYFLLYILIFPPDERE